MNREDIWTISKTISSREPRLLGPKVGDTEIFKNAWKSFFNSFQIISPSQKFHKSQNIFQGEKNEMSLKWSETN